MSRLSNRKQILESKRHSDLELLEIINDYTNNNVSLRELSIKYNYAQATIRRRLVDNDIPIRDNKASLTKYVNADVFKKLNRESAFLLGYIFTDGDLLQNLKTETYFLRIYSKDRYKIEAVKTILKAEAKIQYIKARTHKEIKQSELYFIHIANSCIISDLMKWGMVLDKKTNLKFPDIPKPLIHHFIRGVWSGSGTVSVSKGVIASAVTIGSLSFIRSIEDVLQEQGLKKRNIYRLSNSKKPSYLIKYARKDSEKLYKYLYKGVSSLTECRIHHKKYREYFRNNKSLFD